MNLKNKYGFFGIGLLVALCIIFITSFSVLNKNKENIKSNKKITIGLSLDSLVVERWQRDRDVFMAKVKELGADIIVQNSGDDSDEQINQIKYLISQKVDVLVIVPNNSDALDSVVNIAKKKGIKVICYDRIIRRGGTDLYVSLDNERVGELMAEALVKKVPKGNYIIINGNDKDYNVVSFNQGYKTILNPKVKNGDINIIKEVWAEGWKEEDAYKAVEDALASGIKIDGIIAANDSLAEAAIQALAEHRLAGKVAVVGGDADLAGCQEVVEGLQLMTVYKPIVQLSQDAAEAAVKMAKGEKINATGMVNDGLKNIPIIVETSTAVNKDNMVDVVVKNDFHSIADIYRNVPQSLWPKQ
jgi:D-xylose transport system substrate-binding protein